MNPDKITFFDRKIRENAEIVAFHFNDTWGEFADAFHRKNGKFNKHSTIMSDFKKFMKIAANRHGLEIVVDKADKFDRIDFGVRNTWRIMY